MTDESPIEVTTRLLLDYYASKGRYPRPNDVTPADIAEVEQLATIVAQDLVTKLRQAETKRASGGLRGVIENLDQQADTYEDPNMLVYFTS